MYSRCMEPEITPVPQVPVEPPVVPPVQAPIQPTPPPPKKSSWVLPGIVIIILAGITVGIALKNQSLFAHFVLFGPTPTPTQVVFPTISPTSNPTAEWKTIYVTPGSAELLANYRVQIPADIGRLQLILS